MAAGGARAGCAATAGRAAGGRPGWSWAGIIAPPSQPEVPECPLNLSANRRKPELFVAGECLAEGPRQTLQTMLHEAVHALAHVRGVKDTSRGGKYHNKREFVALAGELGLAWPQGQRPHPVIGFSEVTLTEPTVADYADTLAYLSAAIRLYRDTFRRLGLIGGPGNDKE